MCVCGAKKTQSKTQLWFGQKPDWWNVCWFWKVFYFSFNINSEFQILSPDTLWGKKLTWHAKAEHLKTDRTTAAQAAVVNSWLVSGGVPFIEVCSRNAICSDVAFQKEQCHSIACWKWWSSYGRRKACVQVYRKRNGREIILNKITFHNTSQCASHTGKPYVYLVLQAVYLVCLDGE